MTEKPTVASRARTLAVLAVTLLAAAGCAESQVSSTAPAGARYQPERWLAGASTAPYPSSAMTLAFGPYPTTQR
jgi:hypothetical protein